MIVDLSMSAGPPTIDKTIRDANLWFDWKRIELAVIVFFTIVGHCSPIVDSLPYIFSPELGSPLSNVDRKGIESGPWEERTETCGVLTNQIEGKG